MTRLLGRRHKLGSSFIQFSAPHTTGWTPQSDASTLRFVTPVVHASQPSKREITQFFRARLRTHFVDDSGVVAGGIAIYSLSDPRDLWQVRYVGQTRSPRQRYRQHLRTARLWMPDERPWWVPSPKLRPLYEWIRELYRDERRLPIMVVTARVEASGARVAERMRICECLERQQPLLNFEAELLSRQLSLI